MTKAITRTAKKIRDQIYISTGRAMFVMVFLVVVGVFAGAGLKDMMGYSKAPMPENTQTTSQTEEMGVRKVAANETDLFRPSSLLKMDQAFYCLTNMPGPAETAKTRLYYNLSFQNISSGVIKEGKIATLVIFRGANPALVNHDLMYYVDGDGSLQPGQKTVPNYFRYYAEFPTKELETDELKFEIHDSTYVPSKNSPVDRTGIVESDNNNVQIMDLVPDCSATRAPVAPASPTPTGPKLSANPAIACYTLNTADRTKDRVNYTITLTNLWGAPVRGNIATLNVAGVTHNLAVWDVGGLAANTSKELKEYVTIPNLQVPLTTPWVIKDTTAAQNVLFTGTPLSGCASADKADLLVTQLLTCYDHSKGYFNYTIKLKNLTDRVLNENLVKLTFNGYNGWVTTAGPMSPGQEITRRGYVHNGSSVDKQDSYDWTLTGSLSKKLTFDRFNQPGTEFQKKDFKTRLCVSSTP